MCKILKRLSNVLQPYREVVQIIGETLETPNNARVLKHLISYAEFQFGERIPDKVYRQRNNTERIENWTVEINSFICIYRNLNDVYSEDTSLSVIEHDNIILPNCEKMLEIMMPWSLSLDLDAAHRVDYYLTKDLIDYILEVLSYIERNIAKVYMNRNQFTVSEYHCQRAISYARRYCEEGKTKTTLLLEALINFCALKGSQHDFPGAVTLAEEAYNLAAVAYNPVHPQVQVC
jgi:hypothetical protein